MHEVQIGQQIGIVGDQRGDPCGRAGLLFAAESIGFEEFAVPGEGVAADTGFLIDQRVLQLGGLAGGGLGVLEQPIGGGVGLGDHLRARGAPMRTTIAITARTS